MEKTVEQIEEERIETERVEAEKVQLEYDKKVNSEVDRRLTTAMQKKEAEYKTKLKDEQRKSTLSAEENQKEREIELAEREERIKKLELNASKIDLFKTKGYSLDLTDFVNGNTIEEIDTNVVNLNKVIATIVEKQVVERLRTNSYTPPKGGNASGEKNPFSKEHFNLTEQGKLYKENPTLAKSLMAKV